MDPFQENCLVTQALLLALHMTDNLLFITLIFLNTGGSLNDTQALASPENHRSIATKQKSYPVVHGLVSRLSLPSGLCMFF